MTVSRLLAASTAAVVLALCSWGADERAGVAAVPPAAAQPIPATALPTRSPDAPALPDEETDMRIQLTIGDQRFSASLDESAAAGDLLAQLPIVVRMTDHGGVEKTGRLPAPLSLDGQPRGADPDVGDVGYYAPGNDLVLYYGDQSYYDGIVVLGRLDGDAAERLAGIDGPVTVNVEALDA